MILQRGWLIGLLLLSAAGLTFEINLTRLFSVAQFYHFAFLIVSLALLGYGASGTVLAIAPGLGQKHPARILGWLGLGMAASILGAYLLTNWLPFDSFSIAWDRQQLAILLLHNLALALPFFFSGMAVSLLLAWAPRHTGQTYAVNLLGSAVGCVLALLAPARLGGEGTLALSSGMAALAAWLFGDRFTGAAPGKCWFTNWNKPSAGAYGIKLLATILLVGSLAIVGWCWVGNLPAGLAVHLSPYKSLAYLLQNPAAQTLSQEWNAFSRVDSVRSPSIHSYPGLSYRYTGVLPAQLGITVDGDDLSPVVADRSNLEFTGFLPAAVAFQLRPQANTLALEPRGGLDILTALAQGAAHVTAVEVNPLIIDAAREIYTLPDVTTVVEYDRSFLRRTLQRFDVILLCLSSSYHPVRSGAYSLGEDYRYTVEAFRDAINRLTNEGFLVVTRWSQTPPSEELRAFALAVTAVEQAKGDPRQQIVALRGYNTATLLIKRTPYSASELQLVREFVEQRAFDLNYAPDLQVGETNLYNVLPEAQYFQAFSGLLSTLPDSAQRKDYYQQYPYDVTPPTDNRPFFAHFFKWSQARQVLTEFGKTWQPFGGAGYFLVVALLIMALFLAASLLGLPVFVARLQRGRDGTSDRAGAGFLPMLYFAIIGLAFMLVEIPLIQCYILYLGHPAYAMTVVIFSLLIFSALGSRLSRHIPLHWAGGMLVIVLLVILFVLQPIFSVTLGLPLSVRLCMTVLLLAPLGFLMGMPFPAGLSYPPFQLLKTASLGLLADNQPPSSPLFVGMVWAANGAASVVASVLAALLALSFGLRWVLVCGGLCYTGAWVIVCWVGRRSRAIYAPRCLHQ